MSMEMDTCRKSGIEEISNYAVRLQDKGDKEARENIDKLMIFYVSLDTSVIRARNSHWWAAALFMGPLPGLALSILTMGSAMPIPLSGCLHANPRRLPNMHQLSLESQCLMLVLQDTLKEKNLNGLTNEKVPCIYACYALDEHSSFFSDNHISRRL